MKYLYRMLDSCDAAVAREEESMQGLQSPPPWSVLAEGLFGWDLVRGAFAIPALASAPRGTGERVLVLPGFATGDASTGVMRFVLKQLGYDARGWGLGLNHGDVSALLPRVRARIETSAAETGRKVRLVGWSLGGVLAREVARDHPDLIDRVVTLGTPIVGGPKYTATAATWRRRGIDLDAIEAAVAERERTPIRVPITAIYSRRDGVVAWRACIDATNPDVSHHEVASSHTGLGFQAGVLAIVARALAGEGRNDAAFA